MIEVFKEIGLGIGLIVAILGVLGGILSLPEKIKQFKKMRTPRGDRGTQFFMMSREDTHEHTIAEYLVADDVMHFLSGFGKAAGGATTLEVEAIGEFYRVRMLFKPGVIDTFVKVKKNEK